MGLYAQVRQVPVAQVALPTTGPVAVELTAADDAFLDDLQKRALQFFLDEADPVTGLIPDRARAVGGGASPSSIAATGFGLTGFCIGDSRGWITHQDAYDRAFKVITHLRDKADSVHGYYYHFVNMQSGKRAGTCEVSSIDTALLMAGVLTVRQHFAGTELSSRADELFERVEWPWMLADDGTLSMGWKPETGFLPSRWKRFNEGILIYLLGMGSSRHPLDAKSWHAWRRDRGEVTYDGHTFLQCPPLFVHQYPQCWFDLRGLDDGKIDYFRNSQSATLSQRAWCANELSRRFPTYGPNLWGITASDSQKGYVAWGGPPETGPIDGTVVPCAAGGSLPFAPRECLDALEFMKGKFGQMAYGKYGFADAFNPATGWVDRDVIGIDQGVTLIMAENCRSGFVWRTFMANPVAKAAISLAGMTAQTTEK